MHSQKVCLFIVLPNERHAVVTVPALWFRTLYLITPFASSSSGNEEPQVSEWEVHRLSSQAASKAFSIFIDFKLALNLLSKSKGTPVPSHTGQSIKEKNPTRKYPLPLHCVQTGAVIYPAASHTHQISRDTCVAHLPYPSRSGNASSTCALVALTPSQFSAGALGPVDRIGIAWCSRSRWPAQLGASFRAPSGWRRKPNTFCFSTTTDLCKAKTNSY